MFTSLRQGAKLFWMLILTGVLVGMAGCSTTDLENTSERLWNAPRGFKRGAPAGLYEGR
jgi:hypothetical protein